MSQLVLFKMATYNIQRCYHCLILILFQYIEKKLDNKIRKKFKFVLSYNSILMAQIFLFFGGSGGDDSADDIKNWN